MRRRSYEFDTALPEPLAVDPRSGFTVRHSDLIKEYHGNLVARRFADRPHPLDLAPPRIVERALPYAAPEPEPGHMAVSIMWEQFAWPIFTEDDEAILTEGEIPIL